MNTPHDTTRHADQLYAPNGRRIIASKDWIPGNALITSVTREPDGTLDITWDGETRMCWDGQHTEEWAGKRIFLDDQGNEWREDQLTLGQETPPPTPPGGTPEDRWAAIPDHPADDPANPESTEPAAYSCCTAKRALLAAYDEGDDPQANLIELLADLRHLYDRMGWDFARLDRAAYPRYADEKSVREEEPS
jgi:hypothetical protein